MRLSKELAKAGIGSRRKADALILEGKVLVNGKVVTSPWKEVDTQADTITIEGKQIGELTPFYYYVLNKPKGYVCSCKRLRQEHLVIDLFDSDKRLFTVGRLDKATTGLIIVTNDGAFSNKVIHPSSGITKEYIVKTNKDITHDHLVGMGKGCEVDGTYIRPKTVKKIRKSTLKIVVKEGKKHEVRLLVKSVGLEVVELKRVRIGGLTLGNLPVGMYRPLSEKERSGIFA